MKTIKLTDEEIKKIIEVFENTNLESFLPTPKEEKALKERFEALLNEPDPGDKP